MGLEKDDRVWAARRRGARRDDLQGRPRWRRSSSPTSSRPPTPRSAPAGRCRCSSTRFPTTSCATATTSSSSTRCAARECRWPRALVHEARPGPVGWHLGPATLSKDPGTRGRSTCSPLHPRRPGPGAFTLQVVAETAFTDIAFVALPDVGARNGDFTLPTTYLSIQSDEARHISNGYATLLTVLRDDRNAPLIERDLAQAWWSNHAFLDPFGSAIMEYSSYDRSDPEWFMAKWDPLDRDDWYRSYVLKLGKLGLNFPAEMFDSAQVAARARPRPQEHARFGLPSGCCTSGAPTELGERDYEWLESKYPGWYAEYGPGMGDVPHRPVTTRSSSGPCWTSPRSRHRLRAGSA